MALVNYVGMRSNEDAIRALVNKVRRGPIESAFRTIIRPFDDISLLLLFRSVPRGFTIVGVVDPSELTELYRARSKSEKSNSDRCILPSRFRIYRSLRTLEDRNGDLVADRTVFSTRQVTYLFVCSRNGFVSPSMWRTFFFT
jgi:hypothetical protein